MAVIGEPDVEIEAGAAPGEFPVAAAELDKSWATESNLDSSLKRSLAMVTPCSEISLRYSLSSISSGPILSTMTSAWLDTTLFV